MTTPTLEWAGIRSRPASLLNLAYDDMAVVFLEGQLIGAVYHLPNGYYLPKIEGMQDEQQATPDAAARKVVEMWETYRR